MKIFLKLLCCLLIIVFAGIAMAEMPQRHIGMLDALAQNLQSVAAVVLERTDRIADHVSDGLSEMAEEIELPETPWIARAHDNLRQELGAASVQADTLRDSIIPMFTDVLNRAESDAKALEPQLDALMSRLQTQLLEEVEAVERLYHQTAAAEPERTAIHGEASASH